MDNDGKFWFSLWSMVAVTAIAITAIAAVYYVDANTKITEMVKSGADPILSKCAISGSNYAPICVLRAEKLN